MKKNIPSEKVTSVLGSKSWKRGVIAYIKMMKYVDIAMSDIVCFLIFFI